MAALQDTARRFARASALGALIAAASLPLATPSLAGKSATCAALRGRVVAADAQAKVFLTRERQNGIPEYLGCIYGRSRTVYLGAPGGGSASGASGTSLITLAGSFVAYEEFSSTTGGPGDTHFSWMIDVRDLRTGRIVREAPTATRQPPHSGLVGGGFARSPVLGGDGAVAWIVETVRGTEATIAQYEVHALDRGGPRVLASGPDIDPHSLALAGKTLYWKQGALPRLASLQ